LFIFLIFFDNFDETKQIFVVQISDYSHKRVKNYFYFTKGKEGCEAGKITVAVNLTRVSVAMRDHTRRLAGASRVMWWFRIVVWECWMGERWEERTTMVQLNYDNEHNLNQQLDSTTNTNLTKQI